jgi:hypothetical protein
LFLDFSETAEEQNHTKRNKSCGTIERWKQPKISKEQNYAEGNKSCGTKQQRKRPKISKGTKPYTREQICETTEQTNEANVRFFVQNSPTSEADQNFDQFISSSRPKHCTKSWTSPPNLKKAGAPAREPKSVRKQNYAHRNKSGRILFRHSVRTRSGAPHRAGALSQLMGRPVELFFFWVFFFLSFFFTVFFLIE